MSLFGLQTLRFQVGQVMWSKCFLQMSCKTLVAVIKSNLIPSFANWARRLVWFLLDNSNNIEEEKQGLKCG